MLCKQQITAVLDKTGRSDYVTKHRHISGNVDTCEDSQDFIEFVAKIGRQTERPIIVVELCFFPASSFTVRNT